MRKMITLAIVAISLTGCMTVEQQTAYDVNTCSNFGAEYGSPAHYQCMLIQQQRRDAEARAAQAFMAWGAASVAYTRW